MEAGHFLYIVGCIISLGFTLGLNKFKKDENLLGIFLMLVIMWLLSWAGVIGQIVEQKRKEG